MKTATTRKRNLVMSAAGAFAAIGVFAAAFSGLATQVMAADIGKAEQVPTSYPAVSTAATAQVPTGYQKANYKLISDPLVKNTPAAKDLSKEEAAELGAQMLYETFGLSLENATIYMSYEPAGDMFPRGTWNGDVRFGERTPENPGYGFTIDAVTGEQYSAIQGRTLSVDVPLGMDAALQKDPSEYVKLAKTAAGKYKLVTGDIQEVSLSGQGYAGNDPTITMNILGTDGSKALVTFSRYDKALLSITYSSYWTVYDANYEKWLEKTLAEMETQTSKTNSTSEAPGLTAIPIG